MNSNSLDDRVIAIAGVGGGLGPLVAARLAEAGATVAGTDRDPEVLDSLATDLGIPAERWDGRPVDLLDEDAVRGWCAALVERFGRVDGLVHLVGGWRGGQPLHEAPLSDWDLLHDLLVRTVQHTTRAFHDQLAASRARPLRPRLRQAGAGAHQHERRLRRREGGRRGLDPRLRRRLRARRRHRQHRRHRRAAHPAHAGGEPRRGLPDLHPRRARRRGDRLPLLGRWRKNERSAAPAYHGLDEPAAQTPQNARGQDDDRGAGAAHGHDGSQHPRPPDPRPAAAARREGPHRLLRRGARRPDRADPGNAGGGAEPGGDPPGAREHRGLLGGDRRLRPRRARPVRGRDAGNLRGRPSWPRSGGPRSSTRS